jgi:hypothetical protein
MDVVDAPKSEMLSNESNIRWLIRTLNNSKSYLSSLFGMQNFLRKKLGPIIKNPEKLEFDVIKGEGSSKELGLSVPIGEI